MLTDYEKLNRTRNWRDETIRANKRFVDMYGDPTHFILELIQNAEDALAKRPAGWNGSRAIRFNLLKPRIRIEHHGSPFNRNDVKGITVTLSSTKQDDLTQIGRFGVGFKSVFAITNRPRIHSGREDFDIRDFVVPSRIPPLPDRHRDATVFVLPLNEAGKKCHPELAHWLEHFDPRILLFLRNINEIAWRVSGGQNGKLRRSTEHIGENVRWTTITREHSSGGVASLERWLIFSHPVSHESKPAGDVEIAFRMKSDGSGVQAITDSPLTVYFPTIVKTNLGFLIQGPYRTTLSRENVPPDDPWNKHLMKETARLIPEALLWLRDNLVLDANTLNCFPIAKDQGGSENFFAPLYEATKAALQAERVLPCMGGAYGRTPETRLGSTDAVRQLLSPTQLANLFEQEGQLFWISDDITDDRTPELRRYVRDELGVIDITPDRIIQLLRSGRAFLEAQTDGWIRSLYEFLCAQQALLQNLGDVPLLRLDDGSHVESGGEIRAFLPSKRPSQFPTLRKSVCNSESSLGFLKSLGLREPHPVDDVIENVLPKYRTDEIDDSEYDADIQLIVEAHKSDETSRRKELVEALRSVEFVKTIAAGDGTSHYSLPCEVFLATDEQRNLLTGVNGVFFVDPSQKCLDSQDMLTVIGDCGATPASNMAEVVMKHVLPKYSLGQGEKLRVNEPDYAADLLRITAAYGQVTNEQRLALLNSLRNASFVRSVDTGSGTRYWSRPGSVYLPTERMKELFAGVAGVYIVNDGYECLTEEAIHVLLEACGAARYLKGVPTDSTYSATELRTIRRENGLERNSWSDIAQGRTLRGVPNLLRLLPSLPTEARHHRSTLLWHALAEIANDSGYQEFQTTYRWRYSGESRAIQLDAEIVRQLNEASWAPDQQGTLHVPNLVDFSTLRGSYGWEDDPILTRIIRFKPPAIAALARETGIETEALDLMQEHNLTADDLRELLNQRTDSHDVPHSPEEENQQSSNQWDHKSNEITGGLNANRSGSTSGFKSNANDNGSSNSNNDSGSSKTGPFESTPSGGGQQTFRSYIAVHTDEDADSDGLEYSERLALEMKSRQFVIEIEPDWREAPQDNPGFDLYQEDPNGQQIRFCEVKAMSTTMENRPATMTRTQFEKAQEECEAYWLYVVENADSDNPHLVKIQDPAGKGQTFTFDKGWLAVSVSET